MSEAQPRPDTGEGRRGGPSASVLWAAAVGSGMDDLVDFLLPLWAGASLSMTGAAVGVLVAMVPLGSLVARPVAGVLVDRGHRALPMAGGMLLAALGLAGLAVVGNPWPAATAAALIGAGLGLTLVAFLTHVADSGHSDRGFGTMFAWESRGTGVALVVGIGAAGAVGYRPVFGALAAACLLVCIPLSRQPRRLLGAPLPTPSLGSSHRGGLRLGLVCLTSLAQSGFMLSALLRLQRHDGLDVMGVALTMLPGLVVFMIAGSWSGALVARATRGMVLAGCYAVMAVGALLMGFWPGPLGVGAGWLTAAAGIAVAVPLQRAAVTGAGGPVGRAFGRYGLVTLSAASAGAVLAGSAFTHVTWTTICVTLATLLALGAVAARSYRPSSGV